MKNIKGTITILIITMLIFTGCSFERRDNSTDSQTNYEEQTTPSSPSQETVQTIEKGFNAIEVQIMNMTLTEKIGQMVIVGLDSYEINDNTTAMIEKYHVGGFILFSRNVKNSDQLLSLVNSLKITSSKNKIPLFISIDEEGGRVSRMPGEYEKLPTNKAIGEVNDDDFSYKIGGVLAEEIKSFGFNMNFAPVLDINSNPKNPVIGDRSFGSDAELVSRLGVQTMKGIQDAGIIPVIKHFPGHGDTSVDSHLGLPIVSNDLERLKRLELVPFKDAIDNGADAVMIAHILLNKIDPVNPASLSKIIITDILRKQLNFNGIVISDDMTMGAISKNYNIGDAAIKAVKADSDIILVCHGHDNEIEVLDALKKAVDDGVISKEKVDQSVYRILKLKQKYRLTNNIINSIDAKEINNKINNVLNTR